MAGDYYELTKPRLNFLVLVTTAGRVRHGRAVSRATGARLVPTLIGTALTAAGAAVFNQLIEIGGRTS